MICGNPARLRAAASIRTSMLLVPLLAIGCATSSLPAPPAAPPVAAGAVADSPRSLDRLRERSLEAFYAGKQAALNGHYDCARRDFDQSFARLLEVPVPPDDQLELDDFAEELVASIESYERFAVREENDPTGENGEERLGPLAAVSPEDTSREELDRSKSTIQGEDLGAFGIPVPINDQVLAFVSQFQGPLRGFFSAALHRSGRYLPLFEKIFEEEGLPKELAYMALIESAFKVNAHSPARAHGFWQFIPSTGKLYGLRSDAWADERSDPEKSTRAAARYLEYLHLMFGDWHLAMAAYNAGEGKVLRSIRRSGRNDFWSLAETRHLMRETRNYVPAILAALVVGTDPERFGFAPDREPPLEFDRVELDSPVDLETIARICELPADAIRDLNPELRTRWTPLNQPEYSLRVPVGTASLVQSRLGDLSEEERLALKTHVVGKKESLASVAKRYDVPLATLRLVNNLTPKSKPAVGTSLLIPPAGLKIAEADRGNSKGRGRTVTVRRGESLASVARRTGTSVAALRAANDLDPSDRLRKGQKLRLPAGERNATKVARASTKSRPNDRGTIRYAVQSGDTLSSIATAHGASVEQLRRWNRLGRRSKLQAGQTLTLYATGR